MKKTEGSIPVTQACLVTDTLYSWILNSGATNHVCCSLKGFKETRRLEDGEFSFSRGNGATVSATSAGCVTLSFQNNKYLFLNDVYFVPNFGKNLLSVARLVEQGYSLTFNNGFEIL